MPANHAEDMVERVQSLPQELQDMIFNFTIESSERQEIILNKRYKPPPYIQINRATRERAAKQYYNNACFLIEEHPDHWDRLPGIVRRWLNALPDEHCVHVGGIRVHKTPKALDTFEEGLWHCFVAFTQNTLEYFARYCGDAVPYQEPRVEWGFWLLGGVGDPDKLIWMTTKEFWDAFAV